MIGARRLPGTDRVGHTAVMRITLALSLALLALPLTAPAAVPDSTVATVILVRHAEKNTEWAGADQPLTAAGMLRARELARVLGDAPIKAIYVTKWMRNRQTAEPLARRLQLEPIEVDPVDETIAKLRARRGETVVAVGHSNTVPQILAALMGRAEPDTALHVGYDDLFVLTLADGRPPQMVRLHYGAVSGTSH